MTSRAAPHLNYIVSNDEQMNYIDIVANNLADASVLLTLSILHCSLFSLFYNSLVNNKLSTCIDASFAVSNTLHLDVI